MLARTPRYQIKRLDPGHEAFAVLAEQSLQASAG